MDIARWRMRNQRIAPPTFATPGEVVGWHGAMQGQEYRHALWAIGLRMREATEATVEGAIADKSIVRTWFMRGTLHFVAGADLRWMVALIAPRMRRLLDSVNNYLKLELDEATYARSQEVLATALQGGKELMRPELAAALEREGIAARGQRLSSMLQRAQADGLICYGARRGKQVTFTLVDEWLPPSRRLERDEALAEFAARYFTSHGPATLQDFVTWSGLTVGEARAGLDMAGSRLTQEVIGGQTYWFGLPKPALPTETQNSEFKIQNSAAHLLPVYDELVMGYKDRSALLDPAFLARVGPVEEVAFSPPLLLDGRIVGNWTRTVKKSEVIVKVNPLAPLGDDEAQAVGDEVERYGRFVGLPVTLDI